MRRPMATERPRPLQYKARMGTRRLPSASSPAISRQASRYLEARNPGRSDPMSPAGALDTSFGPLAQR